MNAPQRAMLAQVRYLESWPRSPSSKTHPPAPRGRLWLLYASAWVVASLRLRRVDETSHMQDFAALFRARRPECTTDGALARALRTLSSDVRLPLELRPDILTPDALAEAAIDGLNYQSASRRTGIEERRVHLLVREVCCRTHSTDSLAP